MPSWIEELLQIKDLIKGSLKSTAIISALISSGVALVNGYLLRRQNKLLKEDIAHEMKVQMQSDFTKQNIHLEREREVLSESVKSSLDGLSDDQYIIYRMRWIGSVSTLNKDINTNLNQVIDNNRKSTQLVYVNSINSLLVFFYDDQDHDLRIKLETLSDQILENLNCDNLETVITLQAEFNELITQILERESALLH